MTQHVTTDKTIGDDLKASLAVQKTGIDALTIENVLLKGDLRGLTPPQKIAYYQKVCESLGLNPLTQPFAYIVLNGKEVLYAKRDAAEQLRKVHGISITIPAREVIEGCYVVTARATMPNGRTDESTGAVAVDNLKGEARANALLKAETKAKRRVTLSIVGLGMLDETEVETITPLVISAPTPTAAPPVVRISEPGDVVRIQQVVPNTWGGEITLDTGEVINAKGRQLVELCEAICQEGVPVTIETAIGQRSGKTMLTAVHRVRTSEPVAPEAAPVPITAADIPFAWLLPLMVSALSWMA